MNINQEKIFDRKLFRDSIVNFKGFRHKVSTKKPDWGERREAQYVSILVEENAPILEKWEVQYFTWIHYVMLWNFMILYNVMKWCHRNIIKLHGKVTLHGPITALNENTTRTIIILVAVIMTSMNSDSV